MGWWRVICCVYFTANHNGRAPNQRARPLQLSPPVKSTRCGRRRSSAASATSSRVRVRVDGDRRGLVVLRFGGHDIRHEGLRVAVVERKPGALDLDHDGVPGLEDVVHVVKADTCTRSPSLAHRARASQSCPDSGRGRFPRWSSVGSRASSGRDRRRGTGRSA